MRLIEVKFQGFLQVGQRLFLVFTLTGDALPSKSGDTKNTLVVVSRQCKITKRRSSVASFCRTGELLDVYEYTRL